MSDDKERWIPTPEEVEEGRLHRKRREDRGREPESQRPDSLPKRIVRALGVGRGRKYVEVEEEPNARVESKREGEEGPVPSAKTESETTTVESVSIRRPRRRRSPTKPKIDPNSMQGRFYRKAEEKGHSMGPLKPEPHSENFVSSCVRCGLVGVLVVQRDDNYADQGTEYFRGPAIDHECSRRDAEEDPKGTMG